MDERITRPVAATVAAPDTTVPPQRTAPAIESEEITGPIAPVDNPPATPPVPQPCRCGHDRDGHEHFRPGTECSACDCDRFRHPGLPGLLTHLLDRNRI